MDNLIDTAITFFHSHLIISLIMGAAILALLFFRPSAALKLFVLTLVFGMIVYAISLFGGSLDRGVDEKDTMIHKTEEVLD
ncbi:MAG: hypothetical protein D3926_09480 [Desulfobacteraceae bacterium]|nr:MAG: hypothetical protein D3926_09480 [Desulfobacteraceae bacterium]